jgi:L-threonylcarbamoyladenylate synthase
MKMLSVSDENLRVAADAIKAGLLVAFPTETVYGLGADVFNPASLARVFEAKRRPTFDPLIVHIAELAALDIVADLSALPRAAEEQARLMSERLWPGPLTLILPKRPTVPDLATSGLATVAVRFPDHPVARRLIELSTGAVAAPSANPFGYLSPTRAEHVATQLGERVDFIVDGGRCEVGVESTVLDLSAGKPTILRPGGMPIERIDAEIGSVEVFDRSVAAPKAPGQLPSHYAPHVPLKLYPRSALSDVEARSGEALLFFDGEARDAFFHNTKTASAASRSSGMPVVRVLSESGDLIEAAANLFDLLHELDASGASVIRAERADSGGLGAAINDRLYKASRKE